MEINNRASFNVLHVTFEDPKNIDMSVNRMGGYPCHPIVGHLVNIKNMTLISLYIVQSITKLQQIIRYHQKDYSVMILLKTCEKL
jgi:hypothetical protein